MVGQFVLNKTGFVLNMTGFVLNMTGFVPNITGFVLNTSSRPSTWVLIVKEALNFKSDFNKPLIDNVLHGLVSEIPSQLLILL